MTSTEIRPTAEQQQILDAFATGHDLVIEAGAGTGKTSTLKMIAASTDRKGLYLVYNKKAAQDAKKKFAETNTEAVTTHSLANKAIRQAGGPIARLLNRLNGDRVPSKDAIRLLNIPSGGYLDGDTQIAAWIVSRSALEAVKRFCSSADEEINWWHVKPVEGIEDNESYRRYVVKYARNAWTDINDPNGRLTFEHDHYLKIWALTNPVLDAEFILLDEAQDTAQVLEKLVMAQKQQKVVVGDRCQPAGTMVTVVRGQSTKARKTVTEEIPIEEIREGDRVVSYDISKSFLRRSGSLVKGVSSRPYHRDLFIATTKSGSVSRYTNNHHCLVRIAPALRDKWVVYLMRRDQDYRIGLAEGLHSSQGNRPGFMLRAKKEGADAVWIVGVYGSRSTAIIAEQILSGKYGIPQLLFNAGNRSVLTQSDLDLIWGSIGGNYGSASNLLRDYGRDIQLPFWENNDETMLTRRSTTIYAINLLDGMEMLPITGAMDANGKRVSRNQWESIAVTTENYDGLVYSMTVDNDHTYVADGIVTHNCQALYEWRGAVDAMTKFECDQRLLLSQSFRFGQAIADIANTYLDQLDTPLRLTGTAGIDSKTVEEMSEPNAILCRTNATAIEYAMQYQAQGKRVAVVGGTKEIQYFTEQADKLMTTGRASHPDLVAFKSWGEVTAYSKTNEGADLRVRVSLIEKYGVSDIFAVCAASVAEGKADLEVSTGHKAKGAEWDRVKIGKDFAPAENIQQGPAELRLLYVAVTRAALELDMTALAEVDSSHATTVAS